MCGDFNSVPHVQYEFLNARAKVGGIVDLWRMDEEEEEEEDLFVFNGWHRGSMDIV